MRRLIAILGAALCLKGGAFADSSSESIYAISPAVDGAVIGVASIGAILPMELRSQWVTSQCPCDPASVNSFDRPAIGNASELAATFSDVTLGVVLAGIPIADFAALSSKTALAEDMVVFVETIAISQSLVNLAKYTVQRPVPLAYSSHDPAFIKSPEAYESFYSSHVSVSFAALSAMAMTVNRRYHVGLLPWAIAAAVGGGIAYERVAAGRHFPTDVLMASFAGTLEGIVIPYLHFSSEPASRVSLAVGQHQIALAWKVAL